MRSVYRLSPVWSIYYLSVWVDQSQVDDRSGDHAELKGLLGSITVYDCIALSEGSRLPGEIEGSNYPVQYSASYKHSTPTQQLNCCDWNGFAEV